jgi:predicted TIM-barrel fold metal-dependent hydrolase
LSHTAHLPDGERVACSARSGCAPPLSSRPGDCLGNRHRRSRRSRAQAGVFSHQRHRESARASDKPRIVGRDLLDTPGFWVKLSGIDRIDADAEPAQRYHHGVMVVHALWRAHGDGCVWGSDWPHHSHIHIPDAAALVDALAQIAPSETERPRLLVDDPQRLYGFA